jgi:hypothetical protein
MIMVNISKLHAGTSHGIKIGAITTKYEVSMEKIEGSVHGFLAGYLRPVRVLNFLGFQTHLYRSTSDDGRSQPGLRLVTQPES